MKTQPKNDPTDQMSGLELAILRLLSLHKARAHGRPELETAIYENYSAWPPEVFVDAVDEIISEDWRKYFSV